MLSFKDHHTGFQWNDIMRKKNGITLHVTYEYEESGICLEISVSVGLKCTSALHAMLRVEHWKQEKPDK